MNSHLSPLTSHLTFVDTHCHLDGEEFAEDRDLVVERAKAAGVAKIFLPAIDLKSCQTVLDTCSRYPDYCFPMLGLHPEEVRSDWREQLDSLGTVLSESLSAKTHSEPSESCRYRRSWP